MNGERAFTIAARLEAVAADQGQRPAVLAPGREALRYGQLNEMIGAIGLQLRRSGVGRRSRVGLLMPPGPENATAFLALAAHAVCIPFNPDTPRGEWSALLSESRLDYLCLLRDFDSAAEQCASDLQIPVLALEAQPDGPAGQIRLEVGASVMDDAVLDEAADADIALVVRTSGSTSTPRLAPLHHRSIVQSALATGRLLELGPEDRCLHMLSFFHVHGLVSCVLMPLLTGGSVVVTGRFDRHAFGGWAQKFQPTWYSAVPAIHRAVLEYYEQAEGEEPSSLRFVRSGAVAMDDGTRKRIESVLGVTLIEAYGATEAPQVSCNPIGATKPKSVGISVGPEIRIANERGEALPMGESGEILLRGETVFQGYDGQTEADALQDGWFHTGDLGRLDEDGYLFVTGRLKEMINRGGQKVAPLEVDAVLLAHPAVREAIAFSVPHRTLGEDLAAAVALKSGRVASEQELREYAMDHLPGFKVPSRIVLVEQLPRGPTGKPVRIGLHEMLAEQLAADFLAPQGDMERLVAEELSRALGAPQLGREDNFFYRGGDSLLGQAAMAHIAERLKLELAPGLLFIFPTVASLGRELLRLRHEQADSTEEIDQPRQAAELILSQQEEQFWLLNQMSGELGTYQPLAAIRSDGRVSLDGLRTAVGLVVRQQEIFRTVYRETEDGLKPIVRSDVEAPVSQLICPGGEPLEDWAAEQLQAAARAKFDLANDVPLRVMAYSDDRRSVIGFVFHHIAMDGLSFPLFWKSLVAAYRDPHVDTAIVAAGSYRAYAIRQERRLRAERMAGMRQFWHEHLDGKSAGIDLPFDDRGANPGETYQRLQTLPPEVTAAIRRLARANACSENSLYLAAYFAWLARYTNYEPAVVGHPVTIRPDPADSAVVGCCINTVCLSQPVSPAQSFRELALAMQSLMADALTHSEYPIARLTGELGRHSDGDRRLFQTLFQYRYFRRELPGLIGDTAEMIPLPESVTDLPLTMEVLPSSPASQIAIIVDTGCFSPETADRMLDHFCCLLESVAADPEQAIQDLALFRPEERHRLLVEFNRTARGYHTETNLWLQTRTALMKRPEEPVIQFGSAQVDGPGLVRRAEAIAAALQGQGLQRGDRVGIYLSRSLELAPALLGILAAGAAYVPLDPEFPADRNRFVLEDADVAVLLSENRLRDQLPPCECPVLCLESVAENVRFQPVSIGGDDLAYIIYTSGSTGRPKGVAVEHRNVLNLLSAMAETPGFKPGERLLALSTLAFDISVVELFLPLIAGGRVIIGSESLRLDPVELARMMEAESVSVFQATPTTYEMLCLSGWKPSQGVKLLSGGEILSSSLAAKLLPHCAALWNLYGPTEAAVWALTKQIEQDQPISIGRPLANTEVYVVDTSGKLAPIGVGGELLLGGRGVARGYWNREELTSDRFVQLELEGLSPRKIYRTGDRARMLPNGEVEFLGRLDRQVKIRGHRIELGEIEQCLLQVADVERVIAVVRSSTTGDVLVAYVSPKQLEPRRQELVDALTVALPSYMMPSAWVFLDDFPLTPSRKIDVKKLPPPRTDTRGGSAKPETDMEQLIESIWAELLGLDSVGVEENFFELGGHSLLAVRVVARMEATLQRPISLNQLFRHPTIRDLARAVSSDTFDHSTLVPLRTGDTGQPVYFVHGYFGHVLGYVDFVRHFPPGLQVIGVQSVDHAGEDRHSSIESMGHRYAKDICEHQPEGPIHLCGYSLGGLIAFETGRQLLLMGREVRSVVVLDTSTRNLPRFVYYRGLIAYLGRRALQHARGLFSASDGMLSFLSGRWAAMWHRLRRTPAAPVGDGPDPTNSPHYFRRAGSRYFPKPAKLPVYVFCASQLRELVLSTWRYLAGKGMTAQHFEAEHLELLDDADLAKDVGRHLLRIQQEPD